MDPSANSTQNTSCRSIGRGRGRITEELKLLIRDAPKQNTSPEDGSDDLPSVTTTNKTPVNFTHTPVAASACQNTSIGRGRGRITESLRLLGINASHQNASPEDRCDNLPIVTTTNEPPVNITQTPVATSACQNTSLRSTGRGRGRIIEQLLQLEMNASKQFISPQGRCDNLPIVTTTNEPPVNITQTPVAASACQNTSLRSTGRGRGRIIEQLLQLEMNASKQFISPQGGSNNIPLVTSTNTLGDCTHTTISGSPCESSSFLASSSRREKIMQMFGANRVGPSKQVTSPAGGSDQVPSEESRNESYVNYSQTPLTASACPNSSVRVKKIIHERKGTRNETNNQVKPVESDVPRKQLAEGEKEMLAWFRQPDTKAVKLEYLDFLLKEPVFDTESLIENFSPAGRTIRRFQIELARLRLYLDLDSTCDALNILNDLLSDNEIPAASTGCEIDLIDCYYFWFNFIRNQLVDPENKKPLGKTPEIWAKIYVKAAFYQLFSIKGCHEALKVLHSVVPDDNERSLQNLELLFLKARILGKLRYLEQWPSKAWAGEQALLHHIVSQLPKESKTLIRVNLHLAEFYRLKGYRLLIETRRDFYAYRKNECEINCNYKKSFNLLRYLLIPLGEHNMAEAMAWNAEQMLKLPNKGDRDDLHEDFVKQSMDQAMKTDVTNTYLHRVCALSVEKMCNIVIRENYKNQQRLKLNIQTNKDYEDYVNVKIYHEQVILHLDIAIKSGSSVALVEKVSFLCRTNEKKNMVPLLQQLPDEHLHVAAYLMLNKKKQKDAQFVLKPYLDNLNMYPPMLVHFPVCVQLAEPINLVNVVFANQDDMPDVAAEDYLKYREEILDEDYRLKCNRRYRNPTRTKKRNKTSR